MLFALWAVPCRCGGGDSGWSLRVGPSMAGIVGSELIQSGVDGCVALLELRISDAERR